MSKKIYTPGFEMSWSAAAALHQRLSAIPVAPDLVYFELERWAEFPETAPASLRARFTPSMTSGFAREADIDAFENDQALDIARIVKMNVAPPGFREAVRTKLFMDALEEYQTAFHKDGSRMPEFRAGAIDLDDVVQVDISSHMLFDRFGAPLPVGIKLDYQSGPLKEGRYDLEKVLEVLSNDPRVLPLPGSRRAVETSLRISRLGDLYPGIEDGHLRQIRCIFAPTTEDMKAIWAKCQSYDTKYPSTMKVAALIDLDLLGIQAFRLEVPADCDE